jgi:hypothetical protein
MQLLSCPMAKDNCHLVTRNKNDPPSLPCSDQCELFSKQHQKMKNLGKDFLRCVHMSNRKTLRVSSIFVDTDRCYYCQNIFSVVSFFFRKGKKKNQEGIFHDPTGMKSDFRTNGLSLVLDLIIFINENERNNDERGAID